MDMPSRAAIELHLEEMLHGEEGEDILYATEADLVFPMTVVRGTLELSEHAITFHPERFSGPSCEDNMLLEEKENTEVFWIPDKARSSCARCGDPFRQIIGMFFFSLSLSLPPSPSLPPSLTHTHTHTHRSFDTTNLPTIRNKPDIQ